MKKLVIIFVGISLTGFPTAGPAQERQEALVSESAGQSILTISAAQRLDENVGIRRGGWICLPNGRFERADFASTDIELMAAFLSASSELNRDPGRSSIRSIILSDIDVVLCARNFLPGKSKYYSGEANFTFIVENMEGKIEAKFVNLTISKKDPKTESEILKLAFANLLKAIS
ncbi:MAG: hypothetical protein WAT93_01530 [Pontixanthobacter sp.]